MRAAAAMIAVGCFMPPSAICGPHRPPEARYYRLDTNDRCIASDREAVNIRFCTPTGATAECEDHTWSYSHNPRSMCAHHGGVVYRVVS